LACGIQSAYISLVDRRFFLSILLFLYVVRYEKRKMYFIEDINLDGGTSQGKRI